MNGADSAQRPVRVLHLRDSPWVDGPGRTIIESGAHFDPRRVQYHIGALVPAGQALHPMIEEAGRRGLTAHAIVDRGGIDKRLIGTVLHIVDENGVRILHTSDLRTRILASLVCRARPDLVSVTTAHGWIANSVRRRVMRLLDKGLLRDNDHVIFVSEATRALVPKLWLPADRVTVLHNALVLDSYGLDVVGRERRMPDPGRGVNILNVGRLSPEKGQDLLLRAVAELLREFPSIRLHLAGSGPMEHALRTLAQELGIDSKVTFHGFVRDMPALYAAADVVVQSSLTEGLPNVILEAAYLRIPIVATDVGGTREVVEHRVAAWLIPPRSVADLVDGMRRYLADPSSFSRMAAVAQERILRDFSFRTRTDRMTEIYETCVGLRQSGNPRQKATP